PPAAEHGQVAHATKGGWEGQLRFYPARYAKTFQTWHENIRDWCISRQLWWGHRIPVWRGPTLRSTTPASAEGDTHVHEYITRQTIDGVEVYSQVRFEADGKEYEYICVPPGHPKVEEHLEYLGFVQDPDVLDTWFSSALWPLSTLAWPDESAIR